VRIPHLRWYIAALLFLATVINYIDRQTLSIVAPILTRELHIRPTEYAAILQAFLIAYTVMYVVSGIIVDRFGTRLSLFAFMAWWSVSNMLHAFATTGMHLGAFRFLLGIGESGNFMAAFKVTSEWYPPKERALVNGLVQAGAAVGAIIATPLVTWIALTWGWRPAFVVTGAFGLVWLALWWAIYYLPAEHPFITEAERTLIEQEKAKDPGPGDQATIPYFDLLKYPQTWGLLLARFFSDPVWWFYLFWLPKYLVEKRGFSMAEMGMLAWLPYLSADLGSIAGGLWSGHLVKRNWTPLRARTFTLLPFAAVMPLSLVIAYTPSSTVALAIVCLVTFAHMGWKTNMATVTNDIYPTRIIGSVAGMLAFGTGLGGTLFTSLTGYLVEFYSYNAIFIVMGFLHPIAYVVYRLLVREPVSIKDRSK